jgi:hypothetical protein
MKWHKILINQISVQESTPQKSKAKGTQNRTTLTNKLSKIGSE